METCAQAAPGHVSASQVDLFLLIAAPFPFS